MILVVGTRPEAIKVAPVVLELRRYPDLVTTLLVSTGQHREMLASALGAFGLKPDRDLAIMQHGQTLAQVTARALEGLDQAIAEHSPQAILAQGDTTTTFAAALAAFYSQIPFGHVEAGLRTDTIHNPFPEEFNRRAAGLVAEWHFAPTAWAADNLIREGKPADSVTVTGNTGIDAVRFMEAQSSADWYVDWPGRVVLLTTHRRENWGEPQRRIARAARRIVKAFPDVRLVVAQHANPSVRATLGEVLSGHDRIDLIEPPDYEAFVKLMKRASLILSDSGGVQEEAPAFGIPVLVLRETTERPEGVTAGTAKLVGTDEEHIVAEGTELLANEAAYHAMANAVSPYGDGRASARIRYLLLKSLGIDSPHESPWN